MYNGLSKDVNIINILYLPENCSKNLTKNHPLNNKKENGGGWMLKKGKIQ